MMESSRQIERVFFRNPILSIADYPILDKVLFEIQELESLVFDYTENSLCYIYIREFNCTWFVDIYLYYVNYYDRQINKRRFIIAPGFQMNEKDEKAFWAFVRMKSVLFNTRVCADYVSEMSYVEPDINLKLYKDIGLALFHTYFASFRSGIRELLLKAGLEYVAMDVFTVDGWNIIARNIEEAFNLPINLLRKLNYPGGLQNAISNDLCKNELVMTYRKYHSILNDIVTINEFQIVYLKDCFNHDETVDKRLLVELADLESGWDCDLDEYIDGYEVYEDVLRYHSLNQYKNIFPQYPSLKDIDRFYEIFHLFRTYMEHEEEFDCMMKRYSEKNKKYRYCDGEYEIVIPRTIKDILEESEHQHNCLYQSVMEILAQDMVVVFMREKSKKNKSLVTIEVGVQEILQVKACCNRKPSSKQMMFIDKFAKEKGLLFKDFLEREDKENDDRNHTQRTMPKDGWR